jgi:hypothetical protein
MKAKRGDYDGLDKLVDDTATPDLDVDIDLYLFPNTDAGWSATVSSHWP